ncbi:phospholipase B1, membrane-associated isoform X2 [Hippocampus zosterae]|uniref:phospholipase B1, membrane-associated isoform X2 n=1 Tax=Hippocampus zosterae TaxID=109293 RepID=UPI00223CDC44|nr:phospholipase B1, membrane-associated isoform X2 [Hippocampus zosterae]
MQHLDWDFPDFHFFLLHYLILTPPFFSLNNHLHYDYNPEETWYSSKTETTIFFSFQMHDTLNESNETLTIFIKFPTKLIKHWEISKNNGLLFLKRLSVWGGSAPYWSKPAANHLLWAEPCHESAELTRRRGAPLTDTAPTMGWLCVAVATCVLVSRCVKGDLWWWKYEEGIRHYSKEALNKEFPNKTRPVGFKHPAFQCPEMSPSPSAPSSVELVKAGDIKVVAALGDSLTTAIGANATTVLGIPIEFRHVSWSIGGYGSYEDVITLPNIIKLFNPNLLGAARGKTLHGMEADLGQTGLNLAVTGQNTFNLPGQTRHLIDTLRSFEGLNFEQDWKLLTILMGMNDICDYCKDKALFSPENFIHYMTVSLEMLMNEVPRMIVNVVQILPMQTLREVQKPTPGCLLQRSFCSCLIEPVARSAELRELVELNLEFQRRLEALLLADRFFRDDFAVVLQPFLKQADPPRLPSGKIDMSFFTHDCFHFTIKGHEELAKGLWNNMFQPEGGKTVVSSFSDPITLVCPPMEHPYIFTRPPSATSGQYSRPHTRPVVLIYFLLSILVAFRRPGFW